MISGLLGVNDFEDAEITEVEIDLGRDWSDGGKLVIILGAVATPALAADEPETGSEGRYEFTTRSGPTDGDLAEAHDLAAHPIVFVSNTDGAGSVTWQVLRLVKNTDGEVTFGNDGSYATEVLIPEIPMDFAVILTISMVSPPVFQERCNSPTPMMKIL